MANEPKIAHLSPEAIRWVNDRKALPSFFELSSPDKKQPIPRLSVWVEGLTSVAQAWVLVGSSPTRRWVVLLATDRVRLISAAAVDGLPVTPALDVEWERATTLTDAGDRVLETRPGWEGHAGIVNLDKGNKTQRDSLRWQLADCAEVRILTPDQLEEFAKPQES
jgi:hypothetical protein